MDKKQRARLRKLKLELEGRKATVVEQLSHMIDEIANGEVSPELAKSILRNHMFKRHTYLKPFLTDDEYVILDIALEGLYEAIEDGTSIEGVFIKKSDISGLGIKLQRQFSKQKEQRRP